VVRGRFLRVVDGAVGLVAAGGVLGLDTGLLFRIPTPAPPAPPPVPADAQAAFSPLEDALFFRPVALGPGVVALALLFGPPPHGLFGFLVVWSVVMDGVVVVVDGAANTCAAVAIVVVLNASRADPPRSLRGRTAGAAVAVPVA